MTRRKHRPARAISGVHVLPLMHLAGSLTALCVRHVADLLSQPSLVDN